MIFLVVVYYSHFQIVCLPPKAKEEEKELCFALPREEAYNSSTALASDEVSHGSAAGDERRGKERKREKSGERWAGHGKCGNVFIFSFWSRRKGNLYFLVVMLNSPRCSQFFVF